MVTAILRFDPRNPDETGGTKGLGDYTIPAANPFAGDDDAATPGEIYAYGFRNAHRLSWDLEDGTKATAYTSRCVSSSSVPTVRRLRART